MVYAGILAHGTALSAAETAPMIPQLSAASVRQAMKWASYKPRPNLLSDNYVEPLLRPEIALRSAKLLLTTVKRQYSPDLGRLRRGTAQGYRNGTPLCVAPLRPLPLSEFGIRPQQ